MKQNKNTNVNNFMQQVMPSMELVINEAELMGMVKGQNGKLNIFTGVGEMTIGGTLYQIQIVLAPPQNHLPNEGETTVIELAPIVK